MMSVQKEQYVLLDVARWHLCLYQKEVISIEVFDDSVQINKDDNIKWFVNYKELSIPVYGINPSAQLCNLHGVEGGVVAIIGNQNMGYIGLRCEAVDVIKGDYLNSLPSIPPAMEIVSELVDDFFFYNERLICLTNVEKLTSYIFNKENQK